MELFAPSHPKWARVEVPIDLPNAIHLGSFVRGFGERDPLRAIVTVDLVGDEDWLHLSVSRKRRMPLWHDLLLARDELFGPERLFVQLVPPASAWLNMHPFCMHLFSRVTGPTVPDWLWKGQAAADGSNYRAGAP